MKKVNNKIIEKNNEELIERQKRIIKQLVKERDIWHTHFEETLEECNELSRAYESIIESPFWKITNPIRKLLDYVRGNSKKIISMCDDCQSISKYERWIGLNEDNIENTNKLAYNPTISIIIPTSDNSFIKNSVESITKQTYKKYEILVVTSSNICLNEDKIKIIKCSKKSKAQMINLGIKKANGDFFFVLHENDELSINTLYEIAKALNINRRIDFIYSDEDTLENGKRSNPHFKPDWSPDTILSFNYINHIAVFRTRKIKEVGYFNCDYVDEYEYDFIIRFTEKTTCENIYHISKVLYHNNTDNINKNIKEIEDIIKKTFERRKINVSLDRTYNDECSHVVYENDGKLVSIIIPSKDNYYVLKRCIDSIKNNTAYNNYEIIVVDNGSSVDNKQLIEQYLIALGAKYIYKKMDFNFSKMCNIGSNMATGKYLLLLNDDTEIIDKHWLDKMIGQACQKHIGAVGCKLLYPNTTLIQHCGVINYSYGPSHCFEKKNDSDTLYFYRNKANYNLIAVTAACLLIEKKKYDSVGGFDENLPNNYNDVDFCFRLYDQGLYNVVLNDVKLYHHESLTRKNMDNDEEKRKRLIADKNILYENNEKYFMYDPFYNLNLSQYDNSFDIDVF